MLPAPCSLVLILVPGLSVAAEAGGEDGVTGLSPAVGALALGASVLSAALGWGLRRLQARFRDLSDSNARLAAACQAARETAERAEAKARMLDGVLAAMSDGIAVVDRDLRLTSWNSRFPEVTGVPRKALRIGMPLAEVIRLQAEAGEFGMVDPEAETARRMAILRGGRLMDRVQRQRPDGSRIELRRAPLPGGGFVTLYTPVPAASTPLAPELERTFRAEWEGRMPRLTAAAADGDLPAVRVAAHALRGVAGNAGWASAAATLGVLESAADAGDLPEVRHLAAALVTEGPV
jgi:PAS domain-containing protein